MRLRRQLNIEPLQLWLIIGFIAALVAIILIGWWMGRVEIGATNRFASTHSVQSDNADVDATADKTLCYDGCPAGAPATNKTVVHHIIILSNNPETKFADWVAYRIGPDTIGSHCVRHWERDPDLSEDDTLNPRDYTGLREVLQSDRGHQAPLASLCGSQYWQEADYLSNITPQKTELNEGSWERLEEAERNLVFRGESEVRSITGTLYERAMPPLPQSHVPTRVPSGYWKVISIRDGNKLRAVAFLMDQSTPRETDYCTTIIGLEALERRAHLVFFPDLTRNSYAPALDAESVTLTHALGC